MPGCGAAGYAIALIAWERRDFVRDARFLWTIFLSAMRSITACDALSVATAAALSPADIAWPIRSMFRRQRNARVLMAEVTGFDLDRKVVHLSALPNGDMPEQVTDASQDPSMVAPWVQRWGAVATPLLWSHAMYLIAEAARAR